MEGILLWWVMLNANDIPDRSPSEPPEDEIVSVSAEYQRRYNSERSMALVAQVTA